MSVEPDVILAESNGVSNPHVLIKAAIDRGVLPDHLGKLMDLAERWERNRAADRFATAITAFQRECPQIEKKKAGGETKGGKVAYMFAPYEEIMRVAGPIMARHEIVATFTCERSDIGITITCRIRVGTHQEVTTLPMPIPRGNQLVNESQLMAQAVAYGKRYALSAALNIVTCDEDNDGIKCLDTLIASEVADLRTAMKAKNMPEEAFLRWAGVDSIEQIERRHFPKCVDTINRSKRKEPA